MLRIKTMKYDEVRAVIWAALDYKPESRPLVYDLVLMYNIQDILKK